MSGKRDTFFPDRPTLLTDHTNYQGHDIHIMTQTCRGDTNLISIRSCSILLPRRTRTLGSVGEALTYLDGHHSASNVPDELSLVEYHV